MRNKIFISFILIIAVNTNLFCQNIIISGFITDKNSGESLINVNIIDTVHSIVVTSNKFGFYSIKLIKGSKNNLKFTFVGYQPVNVNLIAKIDTSINIKLVSGIQISEVTVFAGLEKKIEERAEISMVSIPIDKIRRLPSITGESDILKAYQLLPGIQSGSEGNDGLFVRGGTPDENLFLLDDVPLYNVSHLGGLFSVLDPSMVKGVDFYKGGFPARYGGRISSVVDIRNKEGNLYSYNGEIGLSLFLSKVFVEGPIKKEKSSFAFSIRKSNLGIYSYLYNRIQSNPYNQGYTFYDINLKINYKLSQKDRLFLSIYQGRDKFYYKENEVTEKEAKLKYLYSSDLNWGNSIMINDIIFQ